jgi:DNA-binding transcriptional ArsR family regulator
VKDHPSKEVVLHDPEAIRMVCTLPALRYLGPFLHTDHTLSSAAADLEVAPSTLAYWITKFTRVGLVRVVRRQRRSGMTMPVYRATADRWFAPFSAMPADVRRAVVDGTRREMTDRYLDAVARADARSSASGVVVYPHPDADSGVVMDLSDRSAAVDDPGTYIDSWLMMRLTAERAALLMTRIGELVRELQAMPDDPKGRNHLVHIAMAPARRGGRRRGAG